METEWRKVERREEEEVRRVVPSTGLPEIVELISQDGFEVNRTLYSSGFPLMNYTVEGMLKDKFGETHCIVRALSIDG